MNETEAAALATDPGWFPAALSPAWDEVVFVRASAEEVRAAPFLDGRFTGGRERRAVPVAALAAARPRFVDAAQKPAYIFHTAFCCSTLMAHALDAAGPFAGLKEPEVLMHLANARRMLAQTGKDPARYAQIRDVVMSLVLQPRGEGRALLIKLTNSANNLIPDLLAVGAPALFLYSSLEDFLLSVAKKGEACRTFVRTLYNVFTLDPGGLARLPARQAMTFTDLQVAALVWRFQVEGLQQALNAKRETIVTLSDTAFMADPAAALLAVARHFGHPISESVARETAAGPVFRRDVKSENQDFDSAQKESDKAAMRSKYAEELALITSWAAQLRLDTEISLPLARGVLARAP